MRPLRAARLSAERTLLLFEIPPRVQSQVDWATARIPFRQGREVQHIFVLTLGFSRRSFYLPCLHETLSQRLDAHERAFKYFGDRTRSTFAPVGVLDTLDARMRDHLLKRR